MKYQSYLESCVALSQKSSKESSKSHRSTKSRKSHSSISTSSSVIKARLLEIDVAEKVEDAQAHLARSKLQAQFDKQEAEFNKQQAEFSKQQAEFREQEAKLQLQISLRSAQLQREKAQVIAAASSIKSSRRSSSHHSHVTTLSTPPVLQAREYAATSFSSNIPVTSQSIQMPPVSNCTNTAYLPPVIASLSGPILSMGPAIPADASVNQPFQEPKLISSPVSL